MGNPNLQTFITQVKETMPSDLLEVRELLSLSFEPTAYMGELARMGRHSLVVFKNLAGTSFPVVTNVFGTRRRYALALGTTEDKITQEWLARPQRAILPIISI